MTAQIKKPKTEFLKLKEAAYKLKAKITKTRSKNKKENTS